MNWIKPSSYCRALLAGALLLTRVEGKVVINEVFYHAPNGLEDLQWIELYNTSKEPADVSGWALTKGVRYTFPVGTRIPGESYWILSRNAKRFERSIGKGWPRGTNCWTWRGLYAMRNPTRT